MSRVPPPAKWAQHERRRVRSLQQATGGGQVVDEMLALLDRIETAYGEFWTLRRSAREAAASVGIDQDAWHQIYSDRREPPA
jgi:hypothetical protein